VQVGEVVAEMEVGAVGEEEAEAEGFSSKLCLEEVDGSESLAQQFLQLGLPKTVEVLDVACGTGVVGAEVREAGYTLVDGLDPSRAYLDGAMDRGVFRKVYCNYIDQDTPTSVPDDSYDVLLCCAGFFQGLISPLAFPELLRMARPGGLILWNIATGYEHYGKDYARYDEIVMELVKERRWTFAVPVKKHMKMAFTDCGHCYLRGFGGSGGIECEGFTYCMRKL